LPARTIRWATSPNLAFDCPSLALTGDQDFNERFSARKKWRGDVFRLSPKDNGAMPVTLNNCTHFGGISGYDAKEANDEDPQLRLE
jgi:hypothetical protein